MPNTLLTTPENMPILLFDGRFDQPQRWQMKPVTVEDVDYMDDIPLHQLNAYKGLAHLMVEHARGRTVMAVEHVGPDTTGERPYTFTGFTDTSDVHAPRYALRRNVHTLSYKHACVMAPVLGLLTTDDGRITDTMLRTTLQWMLASWFEIIVVEPEEESYGSYKAA